MAQSVTINCPKCKSRLMVPSDKLGAKVQCPGCKTILQTQAPAGAASKPPGAPKAPPTKAPTAKPGPSATAPAPAQSAPTPAQKNSYIDDEDDGPAQYGVNREEEVPRCPNCANELDDEKAVLCVKCGYNLRERVLYRTRKLVHKGFLDYLIWHSLAILFTILIIGIIVWNVLVFTKMPDWLGGAESTGGWIVGSTFFRLWNTIISLFAIYSMGKVAVIRFFLNPHPPEEEIHHH